MRCFCHRRSRVPEDRSRQNGTQAAVNVHCRHPVTLGRPHSGLVCCCVQRTAYSARVALPCILNGDDSSLFRFLSLVTLTFDLEIRTLARFLIYFMNEDSVSDRRLPQTNDLSCESKSACRLLPSITHRHLLLLPSLKADTSFTVPRRVEG